MLEDQTGRAPGKAARSLAWFIKTIQACDETAQFLNAFLGCAPTT
jgi:hypothetical protein